MFFRQAGASVWSFGDVFLIEYANPILPGKDEFTFSTDGLQVQYNEGLAKEEIDRIGVFPNPYFGPIIESQDRLNESITFINLPDQTTIRIFNIAGHLVARIDHETGSFVRWNLTNFAGRPVASGLYIAYIEIPNIGSRILKIAIYQGAKLIPFSEF